MLQTISPRAAAADAGSESTYVSIAGADPVMFGTVTCELRRLRDYLLEQRVEMRRSPWRSPGCTGWFSLDELVHPCYWHHLKLLHHCDLRK